MNPDVIQFQCSACQHVLTVPSHLAGVSGPCPMCGTVVTSPQAAPSFAPQNFGAAVMPTYQEPPANPPSSGQVMPLPNMIAQHVSPLGGAMPAPSFPTQRLAPEPAPAVAWQPPGLGQTMLDSTPPAAPQTNSGFLPQRRPDGQVPFGGSLAMPSSPAPAWNGGVSQAPVSPLPEMSLPTQRGGSAPGHSSLIPGSPSLPMMGGAAHGADDPAQSLLARSLPSAPLGAPPVSNQMAGGGFVPPTAAARSRPLRKPRRASNVFMMALAVIFLAGVLAAVGWLFREPIMQVVTRFMPAESPADETTPLPLPAPVTPTEVAKKPATPADATVAEAPKMADSTALPVTGSFDPTEVAPPKAQPATSAEIASATAAGSSASSDSASMVKPALPPSASDTPGTGLVEVSPKATAPSSVQEATSAEDSKVSELDRKQVLFDVPAEAKPAAEALQKFLDAADLKERLEYTLAPDSMRPIMDRYYSVNSPGPIRVDAIGLVTFHPKPQIGGGAHAIFGVESKTWEFPVPVMLEESGGSFKVDWLSFVEFKDRLLEKFLHTYQEGPARFHVGITRTHYFEDKVPNSAGKEAFRINPAPPNPFMATVFVDKESSLGRDLRDKIPWGAQVFAIVELEWVKLGNQAWVQLSAVPQLNWYSVPSAPKAVKSSPPESSEVPNETQKAVPIGR